MITSNIDVLAEKNSKSDNKNIEQNENTKTTNMTLMMTSIWQSYSGGNPISGVVIDPPTIKIYKLVINNQGSQNPSGQIGFEFQYSLIEGNDFKVMY